MKKRDVVNLYGLIKGAMSGKLEPEVKIDGEQVVGNANIYQNGLSLNLYGLNKNVDELKTLLEQILIIE